jgi:hypothetical protein
MLQKDLDEVATVWDFHSIRYVKNQRCHHGKPFVMFTLPELFDSRDCLYPLHHGKLDLCREECSDSVSICRDEDIFELCSILLLEQNWSYPDNANEATLLYCNLRGHIINML